MGRDADALVKDLDDAGGRADLDRLADQRLRHAVILCSKLMQ
jgi:hypothetical protein